MNLGSIASRMPTTFDPPLDCSPATLAGCHASVRALFDYWWAKRGTRQMPARGVMEVCHDFELTRERWRSHEDARLSRARERDEARTRNARAREECVA